jgi:hypothetical protein
MYRDGNQNAGLLLDPMSSGEHARLVKLYDRSEKAYEDSIMDGLLIV